MEQVAKQRTRVPSHLKPFHRRTSSTKWKGPCTPQQRTTTHAPENSPPRFRLSLRSALKDIVSKDWAGLVQHIQPKRLPMVSPPRSDPVRMKDSDDYLTERAANPRTGLISPSLASSSCRASTPNTPADALKLLDHERRSPTPETKGLLFRRANEGRKISAGSVLVYGQDEACHDQGRAGTPCTLPEDRLVVHMPSAKEPQPFAYPGYSSEQIEAFEYYRRKARRISSDGYDRRLPQNYRNSSPSYSTAERDLSPDENEPFPRSIPRHTHFQHRNDMLPQLAVRKRRNVEPVCQVSEVSTFADQDERVHLGVELRNSVFTPDTTCDVKLDACRNECHGLTSIAPGACCAVKLAQQPHTPPDKISKTSCMAPSGGSVHQGVAKDNHSDKENTPNGQFKADGTGLDTTDLRTLPRVTLVRPEYAATPGLRGHPSKVDQCDIGRSCSLGCHRDVRSGQCLEQRKVSLPVAADRLFSADVSKHVDTGNASAEKAEEVLVGIVSWLLCYIKGIQMPQSDLIETLRSPKATSKEKADALKAALSLAGHVLAVGTALAMIWQLSAAVIQLLQIAFWPLAVPFRILRWLLGAA